MDKLDLLRQLESQIRRAADGAQEAAAEAAGQAREALDPSARRGDTANAVELARMAKGQEKRQQRALEELARLQAFHPRPLPESAAVKIGAIVEIEEEETGRSRTFFLAPAGAGATLLGPGGDGHLTVVTPFSPIGKAVVGCRVGDSMDITLRGETREWELTWVG